MWARSFIADQSFIRFTSQLSTASALSDGMVHGAVRNVKEGILWPQGISVAREEAGRVTSEATLVRRRERLWHWDLPCR